LIFYAKIKPNSKFNISKVTTSGCKDLKIKKTECVVIAS